MKIAVSRDLTNLPAGTVAVVPFFKHDELLDLPQVRELGGGQLSDMMQRGAVRSKLYRHTLIPPHSDKPGILLIGAGPHDEVTPLIVMRLAMAASHFLTDRGYTDLAMVDREIGTPSDFAHAAVEGMIRGAYHRGLLKSEQNKREITQVFLLSGRNENDLKAGAHLGEVVGEANSLARDLVNLPPNEITPSNLAVRAADLATQYGLGYRVLDEDAIRAEGMGAILGVAAGSQQPPRVIVLHYGVENAPQRLAVVGKGITFDSGGLSLKPPEGMVTMKSDMSGAAAVIGGLVAISRLGLEGLMVTGYIGATENMPGGGAMRPGDVLTAMNGETIEVLNTDAEGRLVLADVLSYARTEHATHIVDFATLTGGAVVALGHAAMLATGKPTSWVDEVVRAADRGLERAWPMPLYHEYREAMNSEIADIKNAGGRAASPLTAAAFLSDFTGGVAWAHMDIAGTAFNAEENAYMPKGATGQGVGTIVSVARAMARVTGS